MEENKSLIKKFGELKLNDKIFVVNLNQFGVPIVNSYDIKDIITYPETTCVEIEFGTEKDFFVDAEQYFAYMTGSKISFVTTDETLAKAVCLMCHESIEIHKFLSSTINTERN